MIRHKRLSLMVLVIILMLLAACGTPEEETGPTATPSDPSGTTGPAPTPEPTFDPMEHFDGETIEVAVAFGPGGGYDVTARMFAQLAPEFMDPDVEIVVINMPGDGGGRALQHALRADPDGMTIGQLHPQFVKESLAGEDFPGFDFRTANILGSPSALKSESMYCADRSIVSSWDDVLAREEPLTDGAESPGDTGVLGPWFVELLGGPMRVIFGELGTAEMMAMFDRGELTGTTRCTELNVPRLYPEWLEQERLLPLFWWEEPPRDEYVEAMGNPEPPVHVFDVPELNPTEEQKQAFNAVETLNLFSHMLLLPNDTPDEIVAYWRDIYREVVTSDEYIEFSLAAGRDTAYGSPQDLEEALSVVDDLTPEAHEFFVQLLGLVQ